MSTTYHMIKPKKGILQQYMYSQSNNNSYQYYPTQAMQTPRIPATLKGRPVASLEEARAASIDFDGSVFFFPDLANRRIYTKQINMDGTASFNMYELAALPVPAVEPSPANYITREEFEEALNQIKESLSKPNFTF